MSTFSFFVPRMLTEYDETRVKGIFASVICVGSVTRVDFVPIEGEPRFQKAFIHMEQIYNTPANSYITSEVFEGNRGVRVYPGMFNQNEYWVLLKNKTPVQETKLNIHQVAENARILQSVVEAQANEIKSLREQVALITRTETVA
ncbi:MAG: hypothetical protein ACOVRN_09135 [Flavobacterium sp.]